MFVPLRSDGTAIAVPRHRRGSRRSAAPSGASVNSEERRMRGLLTDLRHAWRTLRRSAGYTALCGIALALGIAANGAMFGLFETLMLRPLPYPQPDRLALVHLTAEGSRF